jgi:iron complex transport system ATP-binding protein
MNFNDLIRTEGLNIRIANQLVCENLNLTIKPGELWGILGQNGSGKTTLLHTLAGLKTPAQGEIYLADKNLSRYSTKKRAQLLGLLFQENQTTFPQTVFEACLAGRYAHFDSFLENKEDRRIAQAALETLELDQKKHQNILTLSGGEGRRLALATLLAQNPSLYLLDEPLNHLDLRHQKQVLHYFRRKAVSHKISVLMALHDINIAEQYCDKILLLLGEGKTRVGPKLDLLTEANLTELYGEPLRLFKSEEKRWWLPH